MKIAILSKAVYRVSATPIQTPTRLFTEIKKILQFHMETQNIRWLKQS